MHVEPFFVHTMWDLEEHLSKRTPYAFIRSAGLLRHLFLDNPRLIDAANRRLKLRLRMKILDTGAWVSSQADDGSCYLGHHIIASSDPTIEDEFISNLTIPKFLKTPMFRWETTEYSVKDVIRLASHVQGGVHRGKTKNYREEIQLFLSYERSPLRMPTFIFSLIQINLVAIESLSPLTNLLIEDWQLKKQI